ncbi:expressed protein [Phakopsora pachyrhizi]|uniref:Expressed protein n=1 Tax=Phakopsora pachyrhizi TaxID=170000 RepID=A0AAV0BQA5_PHAPC|nr:expressed protein [Phakopsora pachyrhizi]
MHYRSKLGKMVSLIILLAKATSSFPSAEKDESSSVSNGDSESKSNDELNLLSTDGSSSDRNGGDNTPLTISLSATNQGKGIIPNQKASQTSSPGSIGLAGPLVGRSGCFNYFNKKDGCVSVSATNNCRPKMTNITIEQVSYPLTIDLFRRFNNLSNYTSVSFRQQFGNDEPPAPQVGSGLGGKLAQKATSPTTANGKNSFEAKKKVNQSLPKVQSDGTLPGSINVGSGSLLDPVNGGTGDGVFAYGVVKIQLVKTRPRADGSTPPLQIIAKSSFYRSEAQQPIVAKVLDGCDFRTTKASFGCSQIYLTKKAFMALNPSKEDLNNGFFRDSLMWDFIPQSNPSTGPI